MNITTKHIVIGIIAIIALQVLIGLIIYSCFSNWPNRGQFGDMFGGVTALFTGLTLAGMVVTLILQSQELKLQREEMAKSNAALDAQVRAMKDAAILNTMTGLVNHYNKVATRAGDVALDIDAELAMRNNWSYKLAELVEGLEISLDEMSKK